MDLAKIRKKSMQLHEDVDDALLPQSVAINTMPESEPPFVQTLTRLTTPTSQANPTHPLAPMRLKKNAPATSPLEAIMSGRTAAGCDDDSIIADESTAEVVADRSLEFLCFRVFNEIYGINIMEIKEIIKPREVTEVPRAPVFISGILSLRGTIIPIIDMRIRLGMANKETGGKERIIVIKNNNSLSGLLVNEVTQVVRIQLNDVEAAPAILDGIDRDFVSGLGRADGRLIIILNLENIVDFNLK